MKTRPGAIIIFALLHLLAPIASIILSSILSKMPIIDYISSNLSHDTTTFLLTFFILPVIMAVSIYMVKPWSIPVILVGMLYLSLVGSTTPFDPHLDTLTRFLIVGAYFTNLLMIWFIFIPNVRQFYYKAHMRWWESCVLYKIDVPSFLFYKEKVIACNLMEISSEGIILEYKDILSTGTPVAVQFKYKNKDYLINGKITFRTGGLQHLHGVVFHDVGAFSQKKLKFLLKSLEKSNHPRRPDKTNNYIEFKKWLIDLMKEKKGFIPLKAPAPTDKKKSA